MANTYQNQQLDFSVKPQDVVPHYGFTKIIQQTGANALTVSTSSQESVFELPPRCMNLSRSSLKFQAVVPTPGAAKFNFMVNDLIAPIRQIQLYTRGGVFICDVNHLERYSKIALKADVMKENAIFHPRGTVNIRADTYGTVRGRITGATNTNPQYGAVANDSSSIYEPQYLSTGVENSATTLNVEIPLSLVKNTILALDKDFFFNEVILLKVIWNDRDAWGRIGGATGDATNPAANTNVLTGDIALTKVALYLALEKNPFICSGLIGKVAGQGLQTVVPYVYSYKNTTAAGTSQSVSVRFSGAQGRHLKKIYHVLFNAAENGLTRYLASNEARDKPSVFHTTLNNERLQEFDQTVADNDDWSLIRSNIKGTLLDDLQVYRYNWCVIEKFDGNEPALDGEVIDSGKPLNMELKYDFQATTNNASYNHYTFAVITRLLTITSQGIMIQ